MEKVFQEHLTQVRAEGRTVLLSSHILSEVETAADRVSIVRAGRIVDSGTLADLRHLTRTSVTATLARPVAQTEAARWPGVDAARQDRDRLVLSVETSAVGDVLQRLGTHGIEALTCQPPTLEELFLSQYRDAIGTGRPRPPTARPPGGGGVGMTSLVGTGPLLRLAWRRDRWIIVASVLALVATAYGSMVATLDLYPTDAEAASGAAVMVDNPSLTALYGPLPSATAAGIGVLKTVMMGSLFTAFLAFAIVRRHTRSEEEDGRFELVAAGVVGRRAPLAAAVGARDD